MATTYAVIMAGGAGTRFWPASRNARPKQLLPLGSSTGVTLIAATRDRLAETVTGDRLYVVTAERLATATAAALPGVPKSHILAEPAPRNTAAAVAWSAATIARRDPEALVGVFPSDHFIVDETEFRFVVARALEGARAGYLTTIGVVPTRPETGYGYIERGNEIESGLFRAARFIEKPILPVAEEYVAGRKHLWNAGMFFFRADAMLKAIETHLPALAAGIAEIGAAEAKGEAAGAAAVARIFPTLPSISLDHGVMEKSANVAVVPGDFGWNDVGSWQSTWELAAKDAAGNALPDGTIAVDASGNLVADLTTAGSARDATKKRRFALVGVSDLVLVETDDAVLVIPRDRAQDVRAVVEALKTRGELDKL